MVGLFCMGKYDALNPEFLKELHAKSSTVSSSTVAANKQIIMSSQGYWCSMQNTYNIIVKWSNYNFFRLGKLSKNRQAHIFFSRASSSLSKQ